MVIPFAFWKNWPKGKDGPLLINGSNVQIPAGSIKDYSSVTIINGGALEITGFVTLGYAVNDGHLPTIIGCAGACTINTGGQIIARENAGIGTDFYMDMVYSAPTLPPGFPINPLQYIRYGGFGGMGGETGGFGTVAGSDIEVGPSLYPTGHGGGGAGATDGSNTSDGFDWGVSGTGGDSGTQVVFDGGKYPIAHGFGASGSVGLGGENSGGISVGGGGEGGTRGISGGCVVLVIAGNANIDANSIDVRGSNGGNGGDGGLAQSPDDGSYGGGGGGGGTGGSGGAGIIRYRTGTVNASAVMVSGGAGGTGGAGGIAYPGVGDILDGFPGSDGGAGVDGVSDIAHY